MFTATLLANPVCANLDRVAVESLRDAWGGGAAHWLNPGIAAEFALAEIPENRWQVWQNLQTLGLDLVVQPTTGRRKKMLLADMDSTMIGQECIDELADMAGKGPKVAAITARAMNGELDFEAALIERVDLLRNLPTAVIAQVLKERITYATGGRTLIATMKAHGAYAALVSGGFSDFTSAVAAHLGFDEQRANTLLASCGKLTGEVARPILGRDAKGLHRGQDFLDRLVEFFGSNIAGLLLQLFDLALDINQIGHCITLKISDRQRSHILRC